VPLNHAGARQPRASVQVALLDRSLDHAGVIGRPALTRSTLRGPSRLALTCTRLAEKNIRCATHQALGRVVADLVTDPSAD
jgi:hypothetical protein